MKKSILLTTLVVFSMGALLIFAQQGKDTSASAAPGPGTSEPVKTSSAPAALGPSSQAVKAGGFIFVSGQLPLDPASGEVDHPTDIAWQTDRALRNLDAILKASGSSIDKVVRTTVYLNYISDVPEMNTVYARYFRGTPPARSIIQAEQLPRNVLVEIDAVALQ